MENRENVDKVLLGFFGMLRRGDGGVDGLVVIVVGKVEKGVKMSSVLSQISFDGIEILDGKDENMNIGLRIDQRNVEMYFILVGSNMFEEG